MQLLQKKNEQKQQIIGFFLSTRGIMKMNGMETNGGLTDRPTDSSKAICIILVPELFLKLLISTDKANNFFYL